MPASPRHTLSPTQSRQRRLNPATAKQPTECPHCGCKRLTRKGTREKKLERVQLWQCTYCRRVFTPAPHSARNTTYPPRVIFEAITTYNLGYSVTETARRIHASRGVRITASSLFRWLATYRPLAAYARLRARGLALFPARKTICAVKLYHRQVYEYAYHRPKLALLGREVSSPSKRRQDGKKAPSTAPNRAHAARFVPLADFLESVPTRCPHALFTASARASQTHAPPFIAANKRVAVRKENTATRIAALILPTVGSNHQRHSRLQQFMLANDSVTVAVEIPIWLTEGDIAAIERRWGITLIPREGSEPRVITGHIDFLQIRNGAIHILDYKPDAHTNKPFAQLTIYALALSHLTGIPLFDFKCAWFNERDYCEFFPRTILARAPQPRLDLHTRVAA
jgi:transposase-like protein